MFTILHIALSLVVAMQGTGAPAQPAGTCVIHGHVTAADSGQPLRKAQVRLSSTETRDSRLATTDGDGAYEFKDVPPGRYQVYASKGSYVGLSYGQNRSTDAPKPLQLLDRQSVDRLDFALPLGAVVTGKVIDEYGEPAPEITVSLERYQFVQGQRRLTPAGRQATTNDIGEFRLFGISPGQYYLVARWSQNFGNASTGDRTAYAPTYYPNVTNVEEAQRVTLVAAQQLNDVAMMLRPIKAARISGTAVRADGKPMGPGMVMITQRNGNNFMVNPGGQLRADGTFTINAVAPGEYTLSVRAGADNETATAAITVTGDDIADIALVAVRPIVAVGRIVVDPAQAQSLPRDLMVSAFPVQNAMVLSSQPAHVGDDYTFELKMPPGLMRINVFPSGMGGRGAFDWAIRSVRINGTDVTESGIEFKPGQTISDFEVELTNKISVVSGLVTNSRGESSTDYTAIVFSQDKEQWTTFTRHQGSGRPDQDGRFKIRALPAGEYYIVAVDRLEPGQAADPEFLERIRTKATAFSLSEGETKTLDLKIQTDQNASPRQ
ncbi:MAG TPA: carboxypeptidase-like regulatory domain-containing protein [Vicinamibacterales bacterium]|jgi:hypothetical protein